MTYITKTSDVDGRTIRGVRCDGCGEIHNTPDVPYYWIMNEDDHYCDACWEECLSCGKRCAIKHFQSVFNPVCENCQEK